MLKKLLKYEFKATIRIFTPIYIAILLVSIVNRLVRLTEIKLAFNLTSIVLAGLFVALGVLTIIGVVQRFNKNLLSDEGYLMFTLPVSSTELIISKLITTIVWTIASAIVAVLSFIILVVDKMTILEFQKAIAELMALLSQGLTGEQIGMIVEVPLIALMGYIGFILTIYLSLATAQLPKFNKHRGVISFVAFFIISTAIQWITVISTEIFRPFFEGPLLIMVTGILIANIVLDGLLFFGTDFILRKHLNLE
jgi:hypothetical protein